MSTMFSDHRINVGPPSGQHDVTLDFKNGPQALPDPDLGHDGVTGFAGITGEKELLGQGATAADEGIRDDEYPSVPDGGTDGGFDISLDSVAPYKYPEYPKDGYTANAGGAAIPLT